MEDRWILKTILTYYPQENEGGEISILFKRAEQTTFGLIHEEEE
jgi:hypothetical protein